MPKRRPLISTCVSLALLVLLAFAACGRSVTAGDSATPAGRATPTGGATLAATVTATVAATPVADAAACNQLPDFVKGGFLEITNLDFPEDGIGSGKITSPSSSVMEVDEYDACVQIRPPETPSPAGPLATVLAVINVSGRGWASTTKFPFDGTNPTACSPRQKCFTLSPQDYLLVENVVAHQHGIYTFHLRHALPAPLIACDPVLFPYDTYPTWVSPYYAAEIPLPPVTRVSIGQGSSQGITTCFCSAGTAASIVAFENTNLPKYGWVRVNLNGKQLWKTTDSTPRLYIQVLPVTNSRQWAILEYTFDLNL